MTSATEDDDNDDENDDDNDDHNGSDVINALMTGMELPSKIFFSLLFFLSS